MWQEKKSSRAYRSAVIWLASAAFVCTSAALGTAQNTRKLGASVAKDQVRARIDIRKIQWPAAPAVPRIQMLSEYFGAKPDPEAKKSEQKTRLGWKQRLAGVEERQRPQLADRKPRDQLRRPYGVVADSKGRIYAADTEASTIFIFGQDGNNLTLYRNGTPSALSNIVGLAIDDTDRLFVTDSDLHSVTVIGPAGELEAVFGSQELVRPAGAAIDSENRLFYVADPGKHHIAVFNADSFEFVRFIGHPAKVRGDKDPGCLNMPTNVAVGPDGKVFVSDTLNSRVQIFDGDGEFIGMFGRSGTAPGALSRPKGIAVDADGHVWIADAGQGRIQIFDEYGHLLAYFGQRGDWPAQFMMPAGLFIDRAGRVIVSDQWGGRVQVFQYVTDSEAAAMKAQRERDKAAQPSGIPVAMVHAN